MTGQICEKSFHLGASKCLRMHHFAQIAFEIERWDMFESSDFANLHKLCLPQTRFGSIPSELAIMIYEKLLKNDNYKIISLTDDGRLVGFVLLELATNPKLSKSLSLGMKLRLFAAFVQNPVIWIKQSIEEYLVTNGESGVMIIAICVDPQYQNQGNGSLLVSKSVELASSIGRDIQVFTQSDNLVALKTYFKFNFVPKKKVLGSILLENRLKPLNKI